MPPRGRPRWLLAAAAIVVVATGLALVAGRDREPGFFERIEQARGLLVHADGLWDAGRRADAVVEYKVFLRHDEHYQFGQELPAVYRRVIEHEAEHGDPGEARDWIVKAWDEWPGRRMRISFESETAERLWQESVARQQER